MRLGPLAVLGLVFAFAFVGRASVLAAKAVDGAGTAGDPPTAASCVDGRFAEELREQAARLEKRADQQASEDQKRAALLKHIEMRIGELERLNAVLTEASGKAVAADAGAGAKIAALYARMKPDLAGAIIAGMDPAFAASLLASMNGDSASGIIATLPPERAYAITVLMAEAS